MCKGKYETHVLPRLEEIEAWARDGLTDKDIANNLAIGYSTINDYKARYPELREALARGKDYVDNVIVVNAYLRRVTGYDTIEPRTEYKITFDEVTGEEIRIPVKVIEQVRHIPGDPRAAEFWLSRRQGKKWPARVDSVVAENDEGPGVVMMPEVKDV